MRIALARRDLGRVFRLLHRLGMSQRAIAAHTGQKQSEVSEILDGRQVVAYDVLVRIGAGLGVARGSMGLEYSDGVADLVAEAVAR
jgi:transcriptional regulator with XRE-family HTH domain